MTNKADGMNYAPKGKPNAVCKKGEFVFAAHSLDHGHIYGMCNGLTEAGGMLKAVYDPDPNKVAQFKQSYPDVAVVEHEDELLNDPALHLIAGAAIPNKRGPLGMRVMEAGKDYFTDKTPFTTLDQLETARQTAQKSSQKYMVYYSERLHVECAIFAGDLIHDGAIGRVVQVVGFGPHRLNAPSRPGWFFDHEQYGGILCDIGSHQVEQFLYYSGAKDAEVAYAAIANFNNPDHPELEDFGEANIVADNGCSNYFRVDWFTPDGLGTWGDGRTLILGTEGYIELRKYIDVARSPSKDHLYLVNQDGERHLELEGKVGFPFFGQLILDCLNRTENAMTQTHAFKAAELCLQAQAKAQRIAG